MKKIIVSVTNDLATDQRVARICESLHKWGYDVLLVGRMLPDSVEFERPYRYKRFKLVFRKKLFFYAEYNCRLFLFLLFRKADVLLSNDLDTLPANYFASKIKRCKLIFDSHEYFPETPEVYKRRIVKNFWLFIEKLFIGGVDAAYTVSPSIASIFMRKYKIKFQVIRNVPLRYNVPALSLTQVPFIIYQGSINLGRGLELIIRAMSFLKIYNLVIAGDGPLLNSLKNLAHSLEVENRVEFTGMLLPDKLIDITYKASVGISIEESLGENYIFALPNKLFDYIQAGVPVLVSDLPEMKSVVEKYNVGLILEERTPENLAQVLHSMIIDSQQREVWKKNISGAAQELCWEKESLKLKELFDEAFI